MNQGLDRSDDMSLDQEAPVLSLLDERPEPPDDFQEAADFEYPLDPVSQDAATQEESAAAPKAVKAPVPKKTKAAAPAAEQEASKDAAQPVAPVPAAASVVQAAPQTPKAQLPEYRGATITQYIADAAEPGFDARPVEAMVRIVKHCYALSRHQDQGMQFMSEALKEFAKLKGLSTDTVRRIETDLFGDAGLVNKIREVLEVERRLTNDTAASRLVDVAELIRELVEKYGNEKKAEMAAYNETLRREADQDWQRLTSNKFAQAVDVMNAERAGIEKEKAEVAAERKFTKYKLVGVAVISFLLGLTASTLHLFPH